jgi:hypothetical protein
VILRYEPTVDSTASGPSARMLVRTEGEWVKYAEYLALEARVAVLEGQIDTRALDIDRVGA